MHDHGAEDLRVQFLIGAVTCTTQNASAYVFLPLFPFASLFWWLVPAIPEKGEEEIWTASSPDETMETEIKQDGIFS